MMSKCVLRLSLCVVLVALARSAAAAAPTAVNESARQVPVAYNVDVVVVGGSTGGVAAAVAAAEAGAKVFLAAPHPYLGDDMTATLRLWLEPDERPTTDLAEKVFNDRARRSAGPDPNRVPFTYTADRPSAAMHADSTPPSKLADGQWSSAARESVQYDGDVVIIADLEKPTEIAEVRLMPFYRARGAAGANFKVDSVTISTSDDGQSWSEAATVAGRAGTEDQFVVLAAPVKTTTRYVKLAVAKAPDVERILLGEIEIVKPAPPAPAVVSTYPPPRPMHVKKTLDEALLAAGVEFLYGCYVTDLVRDAAGEPCGIVMANRSGRQAVIADVIIDATDRGTVARLAGARFRPFPGGTQSLKRVVIGGEPLTGDGMSSRTIEPPYTGPYPNQSETSSGTFKIIEYTLRLPLDADTPDAWAKAEQQARTMTYHPEQQFTSDIFFQVPQDPIHAVRESTGKWSGVARLPLESFRPAEVAGLYVLSGMADISREQAERLLRPTNLMEMGSRIGSAAAAEAAQHRAAVEARVVGSPPSASAAPGDVREFLVGVRPIQQLPTIPQAGRSLPIFGSYDVVVVGGGTGGAPAGIAAARRGAKTLVIEYLHGLGGVGTEGAISSYYWGNRVGFAATVEAGLSRWVIEKRKEWWRSELLKAGADIWCDTMGCGALVDNGVVKGVAVATPQGRGIVLGKVIVDMTGNSDIAAAAGAACYYTDETEFAVQGTGLPPRLLGASYTNTDFTIADDTDVVDFWHLFVYSKNKYPTAFDQGQLVDTRERRRIVGEFTQTLLDQILGRTYPDTIMVAWSNFDSHGYTVDPYLEVEHPDRRGFRVNVPYRCLLPKELEGLLVGGLGMSVHRDAVPMTRMQPDIQNQGYAAGVAAAMAAEAGVSLREIDLRALQRHLIEIGNLPESVLTDQDSLPFPAERIAAAVEAVKEGKDAAVILAHPNQSLPLLREAYRSAAAENKLVYAQLLAILGDSTGVETLIAEVQRHKDWDRGWNYRSGGQFGTALSRLDQLLIALGRTRDPRIVPVVLEKLDKLTAKSEFSHHRAVGLALEMVGERSAAKPLAELLMRPGMTGYVHDTVEEARRRDAQSGEGIGAVGPRRDSIRELILARALYRCGDYGDLGKQILTRYTSDLRGHLARHAKAVLEAEPAPPRSY